MKKLELNQMKVKLVLEDYSFETSFDDIFKRFNDIDKSELLSNLKNGESYYDVEFLEFSMLGNTNNILCEVDCHHPDIIFKINELDIIKGNEFGLITKYYSENLKTGEGYSEFEVTNDSGSATLIGGVYEYKSIANKEDLLKMEEGYDDIEGNAKYQDNYLIQLNDFNFDNWLNDWIESDDILIDNLLKSSPIQGRAAQGKVNPRKKSKKNINNDNGINVEYKNDFMYVKYIKTNGIINGLRETFFNDILIKSEEYKDGSINGIVKTFNKENGAIKSKEIYINEDNLSKSKKEQEVPDWYDGTLYEEGITATNSFTGISYKLNAIEASIYDLLTGVTYVSIHGYTDDSGRHTPAGWTNETVELKNKCEAWFKETNPEAYKILFEPYSRNENTGKLFKVLPDIRYEYWDNSEDSTKWIPNGTVRNLNYVKNNIGTNLRFGINGGGGGGGDFHSYHLGTVMNMETNENGYVQNAFSFGDTPVGIRYSFENNGNILHLTKFKDGKRMDLGESDEKKLIDSVNIFECHYPNGNILESREMKGGKVHGAWKRFYSNGILRYITNHKNGEIDGEVKGWGENGDLVFEGKWENGNWSGETMHVLDDNVKSPEHNSGNAEKKVQAKVNYNTTGVERRKRIRVNKAFGDGFYKSMSANDDADAKTEQIELKGSGCMLVLIIGFLITFLLNF